MSFRLRNTPVLSRIGADRADDLRTDIDAAIAGWAEAQLLRVDTRNQVLVEQGRVVLTPAAEYADTPPADAVFLGRLPDDRHVWAIRGPLPEPPEGAHAADLRRGGADLDDVSAQLFVTATALLNWHDGARFSPLDGATVVPIRSGWARQNPDTGHEEFPRIDPAVIVLVDDGADRVVLARQAGWPEKMYSLLAGFVEAGESFEACVVREAHEEVGLAVSNVRYLGSQPWPFPRSLMVGFHGEADPNQPFVYSDGEIAEARWFTRDQVRAALGAGDWSTPQPAGDLLLPGSVSIAREIIESWAFASE